MNFRATLANSAWLAASLPAHRRFVRALAAPESAQWAVLHANLTRNATSAYGRAHGFGDIRHYGDFARRVPVSTYDDLAPWIARIARGETSVLTTEPVTRLLPTSGSTGARKLIPFTASLQHDFNAAIGPWIVDLAQRHPAIAFGPAYWSVSPLAASTEDESFAVPVGFEDDSQYLGGARAWLLESAMAVPSAVRHLGDLAAFRHAVLLSLLRRRDLRLISVWHPSFLALLLDDLPEIWDALLADLATGTNRHAKLLPPAVRPALSFSPQPGSSARLRHADPSRLETVWPALHVVSCWADGHASGAAAALQRRLPHAVIQPKGLLATEAFVTIPFRGAQPLAVCSHFFEFIDGHGAIHPSHLLREGETYEVIVTTSSGLWRYRLGDRVRVEGFTERTPSLRFLGRAGNVSDRFGEKLAEDFVAEVISTVCASLARPPTFAMLAPEDDATGWHYTLYLETDSPSDDLASRLDTALRANPHYALCRDLGQLNPARVFPVTENAYATYAAVETVRHRRLGDLKPTALSQRTDWAKHFVRCEADSFAGQKK